MAPTAPTASSSSRSRPIPKRSEAPTPQPAAGRVTRLRAAKDVTAGPAVGSSKGPAQPRTPGLLAKSKEGFRKVSGKIGQKDKEAAHKEGPGHEGNGYSQSLQAYLRIRPSPTDSDGRISSRPYLEIQSETDVLMRAPTEQSRHHIPKPPHIYSFDKVFPPTTPQSSFFTTTTLPLVERLLQGENGLMFAYGVSNSGKSYTIQGGSTHSATDRGVLPRSIDVVFNSIEGLESTANLKPQGLADVVLSDDRDEVITLSDPLATLEPKIEDSIKVDRNYSYAVFVSYAEVYNEKIFDLLDTVLPTAPPTPGLPKGRATNTGLPRGSNAYGFPGTLHSSFNLAAIANGGGGVLKRHALALKNDPEGNGKYIAGLKDVRVRTREEALAVFRSGQSARQVFGTIANRESSRSHGIFTIKIVRIHNGAPEDPDSAQVSRLAIVDLAGSERTRNTQTTGDRLKEAGNINKSLMVLGQCLEVLRANQQKMSTNPGAPNSKKRLAVVPFRHSKLTEVFQNFFVGDGRAVIIVNVNPYDTGFDENSHVMRFSAIAREIQTTASNKVGFPLLKRQISTQFSAFRNAVSGHHTPNPMKIKVTVPVLPKPDKSDNDGKKLAMDRESQGFVMVEEELEVVEESEEDQSDEEDGKDALVEYLFDQLKEMKTRLYESEMKNAAIEVEVREEVAKEMQDSLQKMHEDFGRQLSEQLTANELKTDRKIDIVTRTMTPAVHRIAPFHPSSASSSNIDEESQEDVSFVSMLNEDESFESAIDASLMTSGDDSVLSQEFDPFVVKSPGIPQITLTRDSFTPIKQPTFVRSTAREKNADISVDTGIISDGTEQDEAAENTTKEDIELESEVDDDDTDAVKPIATVVSSEEESVLDTDEDVDEAEDEDVTENEESEDEEEEANEEEVDSDESAFTLSDPEAEEDGDSEEEEESPIRRASSRRRTAGSPKKPVTALSPVKKAKETPAKKISAKTKVANALAQSPGSTKKVDPANMPLTPEPLRERISQLQLSDDEEMPIKTTTKKKRTLGKKIVTEDEMIHADSARISLAGAEVRRMIR
ncbi:uncharacterized protein I206_105714 [Kwoniella pini CBS 10737]|uniref:Kinesin family member 20/23 n=1 Tax=Kwoniella pini CBS 10737 TaxID=1296096 RepID=A0A1B9I3F4_9TREE|nr:kinesin family member 20/23 [Kwoniella pini CBS 10737]OCF50067.1 kinesin family member 20/23 [Kwoniella pini CBS 10737]